MTYAEAFEALVAMVKLGEGCCLRAYPDPASPLAREMAKRRLLYRYMKGDAIIPGDLKGLSGAPWTIGYGETRGVFEGMEWTQEHAEAVLRTRLVAFLTAVLKKCPRLHLEPLERLIACTDLAYNIGTGAFGASSVCRKTTVQQYAAAAKAFLLWNKAQGHVEPGLTRRRQMESKLYLSANE